jgi:hypothetical protein
MPEYKFIVDPELKGLLPSPVPASKAIPDWYKSMPRSRHPYTDREMDSTTWLDEETKSELVGSTFKECIPVRDYLTSGYIIPMWSDVELFKVKGNLQFNFTKNIIENKDMLNAHLRSQYMDTSLWDGKSNTVYMPKLNSPWGFKTPIGYSSLFFSPRYTKSCVEILPAVIDTDDHHQINFPFIFKGEEGEKHVLEAGTPIIQVVPFKREVWTSSLHTGSFEPSKKYDSYLTKSYLKLHHKKKKYT